MAAKLTMGDIQLPPLQASTVGNLFAEPLNGQGSVATINEPGPLGGGFERVL